MSNIQTYTIAVFDDAVLELNGSHNVRSIEKVKLKYGLTSWGRIKDYYQARIGEVTTKDNITHRIIRGRVIRVAGANGPIPQYLIDAELASDEDLIEMYSNALATYYGCGGHNKAEMNRIRYEKLEEIIKSRRLSIPINAREVGVFNGKGAY
jgi:hypothetical protein